MLAALKIVHFLALAVGLGGGVANGIVGAMAGPRDPAVAGQIQRRIGRLSFAALVLLWVTGVAMVATGPGLDLLGGWFWLKMAAAVVLTAAAVTVQVSVLALPAPRAAARARPLGRVMTAAASLAVVFAVLAFG
jgi:uncharacterized membrane protein